MKANSTQNSPRSASILYCLANDCHSECIAMAMAEKGVTHQICLVDLSHPPENLLEISPSLELPALLTRDIGMYAPEIILGYLDERFPHPQLLPHDPIARVRYRLLRKRIIDQWYPLIPLLQASESKAQFARQQITELLTSISPLLTDHPYFQGSDFSLIDMSLTPIMMRIHLENYKLASPALKVLQRYVERLKQRPSVQHVYPIS